MDSIQHLWVALDRLWLQYQSELLEGESKNVEFLWEVDDEQIRAVWNELTNPGNINALELRAGRNDMNTFAQQVTNEAVRQCRLRLER